LHVNIEEAFDFGCCVSSEVCDGADVTLPLPD